MPPYFIYPDIVALQEGRATEHNLRRIAANIGDPAVVRRLLRLDPEEFADFYQDLGQTRPSTLSTIDTFLSTYSRGTQPTPPAVAEIMDEGNEAVEPAKNVPETETLEQLIKSRRYEAALERIKEQNLNNPEKSIYFADQMRFLEKLVELDRQGKILPRKTES